MSKRIWFYFYCFLILAGFLIAGVSEWQVWKMNRLIEESFEADDSIPYYLNGDEITLERMQEYLREMYRATAMNAVSYPDRNMVLEEDLCYYASPRDKKPAYLIPEGTEICFYFGTDRQSDWNLWTPGLIYGLNHTFPAYEDGWRLATPFFTVEEMERMTAYPESKVYYVKTQELMRVWIAFSEQWTAQYGERNGYGKEDGRKMLYSVDEDLYESGYYLSDSVYKSYLTKGLLVGLMLAGGTALLLFLGALPQWNGWILYIGLYAIVMVFYLASPRFGWSLLTPQGGFCTWQGRKAIEQSESTKNGYAWYESYAGLESEIQLLLYESKEGIGITYHCDIIDIGEMHRLGADKETFLENAEKYAPNIHQLSKQLFWMDKQKNVVWHLFGIHVMFLFPLLCIYVRKWRKKEKA